MIDDTSLAPLCADSAAWLDPLRDAMTAYQINTYDRVTMFLATCAYESARFSRLEENLNYSAEGLLKTWPGRFTPASAADYARQPERIANRVYAGRGGNGEEPSGDGWRYRGRGPIQITFRENYAAAEVGTLLPLLREPDRLLEPAGGAKASAWFWKAARCNQLADEGDFRGVCGVVNRGSRFRVALHQEDRDLWLQKAQSAIPR